MMERGTDDISKYYLSHLSGEWKETFTADCPFCTSRGFSQGTIVVFLNPESFFHGYFRCRNRCVPGGYPLWYAQLASIPYTDVPGYDPEQHERKVVPEYPFENLNDEIRSFRDRISPPILQYFKKRGVSEASLREMQIGFNGRYLVFPYFQEDGNCYSARCVYPDKPEDCFWQGEEKFSGPPHNLYNIQDLSRCENGALFLCEREENLLALKQLGFPAVGVVGSNDFDKLAVDLFSGISTLFITFCNTPESENSARSLAARIGFKARLLQWPQNSPRNFSLWHLAQEAGKDYAARVAAMIQSSRAFSPFSPPEKEFQQFRQKLKHQSSAEYRRLSFGFPLLDEALGGIHGLNVVGGAPKVGKSTFMIQIGAALAARKVPVLYYDFENGRQKIYQRTLSRLAQVKVEDLSGDGLGAAELTRLEKGRKELEKMLFYWRIINDRKISPELMRKHVEFIRHETRSNYTVVIIDSLHNLPFKEFSEQRTGIDAWLRQLESIRDELQVSFLVISELSRGLHGVYDEEPHLGVFKGSGDIEYSADNAMVLFPSTGDAMENGAERVNNLWLVASREHSPGRVADFKLDYPFWGFTEQCAKDVS
jgi:replicative DNA helicase